METRINLHFFALDADLISVYGFMRRILFPKCYISFVTDTFEIAKMYMMLWKQRKTVYSAHHEVGRRAFHRKAGWQALSFISALAGANQHLD